MSSGFKNEDYPHGSARFAKHADIKKAGFFKKTGQSIYCGEFEGKPLYYDGDGGIVCVAGARGGKGATILTQNLCHGMFSQGSAIILDPRGENAAMSQDQTPDKKHCIYWNARGLHGLPQMRINPVDYLKRSSPSLDSDLKVFLETLCPESGSANAAFFEMRGREWNEAICKTLIQEHGVLTLPDLYDTVNALAENGPAWMSFSRRMRVSTDPFCRRVAREIANGQKDSRGGYQGILAEMLKSLAPLSDRELRASVSAPFDFSLEDMCSPDQFVQFYAMVPQEMLSAWAPIVKTLLSAAMIYKMRRPEAPPQTWCLDECGQLKNYDVIPKLFSFGAGSGIRPFAIFQTTAQMDNLGKEAKNIILSSAGMQLYFAVRDYGSAQTISNMIGAETLRYGDPLYQGRAEVERQSVLKAILSGGDPFKLVHGLFQKFYEARHRNPQKRLLLTPDEVLNMPANKMLVFADNLPGPIYGTRRPYWTQIWMAGRYHPNPYHPPKDKVSVMTRWGQRWWPVMGEDVPEEFAHYPQYRQSGRRSYIGRP